MPNRKYPQVDEGTYVPYAQPSQLIPPLHRSIWAPPDQERLDSLKAFDKIHHRTAAGHRDPLSVLLTLDLLERWNPDFYVRSKYVARGLNERQDWFYFEPITVGKILAELSDLSAEMWAKRPDANPIKPIIDYKGVAFLILNDIPTYKWFWQLRQELIGKCQAVMQREAEGISIKKFESPWEGLDTSALV